MKERPLTFPIPSSRVQSILLLPFEDQEIQASIAKLYPQASLTVLTKHDLAGKPPLALLRLLRQQRWSIVIASLHESAVRRNLLSVEVLLAVVRATWRFIRTDESTFLVMSSSRFFFNTLPRVLVGTAVGMAVLVLTYANLFWYQIKTGVFDKRGARLTMNERDTVLFLRTDLAGHLKAGGSVTHVRGIVKAFRKAGFEVVYLADAPLEDLPRGVRQLQILPLRILDFFDEFQLLAYNIQLMAAGRIIERIRPALIYQRHSVFNFAGGVLAHRIGVPIVLETNASEVWVKEHWSRLVLKHVGRRCEALAFRLASLVTVISSGVREQLEPYHVPANKIIINPNGVDPEEFEVTMEGASRRRRMGIADEIVVGFVGTFTRWHGVETLYEAARLVIRNTPRVHFLFVGDGDLRSSLQQRSRDDGIQNSCSFTGLVAHHEVPHYLVACDILVSPHLGFADGSRFFGSPTKLFEYMATGKAIIASNLEQLGEIIEDGLNGLHMEPGNVQQLADLIQTLAADQPLRQRLGTKAREDVVAKYTWDKNVDRIIEFLGRSAI